MSVFTDILTESEFGVSVQYGNGYIAYVSPDDEQGGYRIGYHKLYEDMPAHATDYAEDKDEAEAMLITVGADFGSTKPITVEE